MSKQRGKSALSAIRPTFESEPEQPSGLTSRQPDGGSDVAAWASWDWGVALVALLLALLYLAVFLTQSLVANLPRWGIFLHLLTPDDLALGWVDGRWSNFNLQGRGTLLISAGLPLAVAYLGGRGLLVWLVRVRNLTPLESTIFSLGIGLHGVSLLVLGLGLAGRLTLVFPALVATGAAGMTLLLLAGRWQPQSWCAVEPVLECTYRPLSNAWRMAGFVLMGCFTLVMVLGAMLPPWDFDVREYHLQVPKEWNQQGRITFLPHNVYGNMPLGAETLAIAAMRTVPEKDAWWFGALAGKLQMACFAPLTALALYSLGRRYLSVSAGIAAALVFLSHPWVVHVSIGGLNEAAVAFYMTLGLGALLLARGHFALTGLAGYFAGAALACKYTALLFVVLPLGMVLLFLASRRLNPRPAEGSRWQSLVLFAGVALLSAGPWLAKNWVLAGNPTYPLLVSMFGGQTRTAEKDAQWQKAHQVPPVTLANLTDTGARIGWRSEFQSPLLVPLTLLGISALVLAAQRHGFDSRAVLPLAVAVSLLVFILASWWLFTHRLDRFLVPAIPLAALLAGAGVEYSRAKPLKYVTYGLLIVGLTYNLLIAASAFPGDNRWFVSLEKLRRDRPRGEANSSRVKAAHRWLNENVPSTSAVLCVGEAAVFDLEMPVFYNTCFDDSLLVEWMQEKSLAERKQELAQRQIKYVYVDWGELNRYGSPGNYGYDQRFSRKLLEELVTQGVLKPPLENAPAEIYPVVP